MISLPMHLIEDDNHPEEIKLPPDYELPITKGPNYTLYRMLRYIKPNQVLEIGAQHGGSSVPMALAMRDNGDVPHVVSIDPYIPCGDNDGLETLTRWYKNTRQIDGVVLVIGKSSTAISRVISKRPTFDFVFIDGCHEEEAVYDDFDRVWPMTSPGGYILFHDYSNEESVMRAVDRVGRQCGIDVAINKNQRYIADTSRRIGWAIVRKPQ